MPVNTVNFGRLRDIRLTTLLALQCLFPFQADDWNRNQRGGGVNPTDMKHRVEDQTGKREAGKVGAGIRSNYRRQRPKARGSVPAKRKREQGRTQPPSRSV